MAEGAAVVTGTVFVVASCRCGEVEGRNPSRPPLRVGGSGRAAARATRPSKPWLGARGRGPARGAPRGCRRRAARIGPALISLHPPGAAPAR
eukprot:scaffold910_cov396-Prasinococcus_capsulatus_cf.AAC.36